MKKTLALALLGALLTTGLSGCNDPIPALKDPYSPIQISLEGYVLQNDVRVTVLPVQRTGQGQMRVVIQLYNRTPFDLSVDYKYYFVDGRGAQVDVPSGWQFIKVPPKGTNQFEFVSLSAMADDFRVQLRKA